MEKATGKGSTGSWKGGTHLDERPFETARDRVSKGSALNNGRKEQVRRREARR